MLPKFKAILISITEKCHVGCGHCGFIGAVREREAEESELQDWVRQACEYGIPNIIFTGGEPFERFECLEKAVAVAEQAGIPVAVFTSSFWASTYDDAFRTLKRLPGLKHLYLSSDIFHQRKVPYQYVFNVIDAATRLLNIEITICITYTNDNERAQVRDRYAAYGERLRFHEDRVIPNPYFSKVVLSSQGTLRPPRPEEFRCGCEIGTPLINPNGHVFSCHVGKAAAHRDLRELPYYLGNLYEQSFAEIMKGAALRLDYQFLRTFGAEGVASLYVHDQNLTDKVDSQGFTTACDMCFSTLKTGAGRSVLEDYVKSPTVRDAIDIRLTLLKKEGPIGYHEL